MSVAAVLVGGLALAPQAQAQYTAQFVPPPTEGQPAGMITPFALNNRGQVFARNFWGGASPDRGPVLSTNGVTVALPMPTGYHFVDSQAASLLNDLGVAVSTVQLDSATGAGGVRPVIWHNGAATVLPVPMDLAGCASRYNFEPPPYTEEKFSVLPVGLNRAGHVLILACNTLWIVDSSGSVIVAGPPPADVPPSGLQPVYFADLNSGGNHLNDADVASAQTGLPGVPELIHPGILSGGLSSFFPLPLDYGNAKGINNRNQQLAFFPSPPVSTTYYCRLWTGTTLADLGICGTTALNDLGQVAFMTSGNQPRLYKDGVVNEITLPPEVPGLLFSGGSGLNDAGQIIGEYGSSGVLLTPSGPCAADATSQTVVRRGRLRYDATTQHYTQAVVVRNKGTSTLAGPISVALDNVPATATLFNLNGATSCNAPAGSFYLDLPVASLAPGARTTGTLEFIDPTAAGITYGTRVFVGAGRR